MMKWFLKLIKLSKTIEDEQYKLQLLTYRLELSMRFQRTLIIDLLKANARIKELELNTPNYSNLSSEDEHDTFSIGRLWTFNSRRV